MSEQLKALFKGFYMEWFKSYNHTDQYVRNESCLKPTNQGFGELQISSRALPQP